MLRSLDRMSHILTDPIIIFITRGDYGKNLWQSRLVHSVTTR
jgi:hypothetical protein